MPFLIDGHNLIPHITGLSLEQLDDELALLELLAEYFNKERKKAVVYFDRASPGQVQDLQRGFVSAHFTRPPINADIAIRNAVNHLGKTTANYTIVSSDLEVTENARRKGARVISSTEFAKIISSVKNSGKGRKDDPPNDLDYWYRVFGEKS